MNLIVQKKWHVSSCDLLRSLKKWVEKGINPHISLIVPYNSNHSCKTWSLSLSLHMNLKARDQCILRSLIGRRDQDHLSSLHTMRWRLEGQVHILRKVVNHIKIVLVRVFPSPFIFATIIRMTSYLIGKHSHFASVTNLCYPSMTTYIHIVKVGPSAHGIQQEIARFLWQCPNLVL